MSNKRQKRVFLLILSSNACLEMQQCNSLVPNNELANETWRIMGKLIINRLSVLPVRQ